MEFKGLQLTLVLIDPDNPDFWEDKKPVELLVSVVDHSNSKIKDVGYLEVPWELFDRLHSLSFSDELTTEEANLGNEFLFQNLDKIKFI